MELSNLLGVSGQLRLAEESFEDLRRIPRTLERIQNLRDAVKIYSEEKELLGILLHENQHWLLLTDICLLYTSPSPRDRTRSRMPSSA